MGCFNLGFIVTRAYDKVGVRRVGAPLAIEDNEKKGGDLDG